MNDCELIINNSVNRKINSPAVILDDFCYVQITRQFVVYFLRIIKTQ